MKVWKDRSGKAVEGKEFVARWKQGIKQITPIQQMKVSLFGYSIVFLGIIWGMIYSGLYGQWWLLTILSGSFIISGMQVLPIVQRMIFMITIEKEVLSI